MKRIEDSWRSGYPLNMRQAVMRDENVSAVLRQKGDATL
jgi:hypothetical protein